MTATPFSSSSSPSGYPVNYGPFTGAEMALVGTAAGNTGLQPMNPSAVRSCLYSVPSSVTANVIRKKLGFIRSSNIYAVSGQPSTFSARLQMLGDSKTMGQRNTGAASIATANAWAQSTPYFLVQYLNTAKQIPTKQGGWFGGAGIVSGGPDVSAWSTRITLGSGWGFLTNNLNLQGPGGAHMYISTQSTSSRTQLNVADTFDTLTIFNTGQVNGTYLYDVDAGTQVSLPLTPSTAPGIVKHTVSVTRAAHTSIGLANSPNYNLFVPAVYYSDSQLSQLYVDNCGASGFAAAPGQGSSANTAAYYNQTSVLSMIGLMAPDIAYIELGNNDLIYGIPVAGSATAAITAFSNAMIPIINAYQAAGTAVVLGTLDPFVNANVSDAVQQQMRAAVFALASPTNTSITTPGLPVIDNYGFFGASGAIAQLAPSNFGQDGGLHCHQGFYANKAAFIGECLTAI